VAAIVRDLHATTAGAVANAIESLAAVQLGQLTGPKSWERAYQQRNARSLDFSWFSKESDGSGSSVDSPRERRETLLTAHPPGVVRDLGKKLARTLS
jgi:hypothetical protein